MVHFDAHLFLILMQAMADVGPSLTQMAELATRTAKLVGERPSKTAQTLRAEVLNSSTPWRQ
jgi:hypothetical protein